VSWSVPAETNESQVKIESDNIWNAYLELLIYYGCNISISQSIRTFQPQGEISDDFPHRHPLYTSMFVHVALVSIFFPILLKPYVFLMRDLIKYGYTKIGPIDDKCWNFSPQLISMLGYIWSYAIGYMSVCQTDSQPIQTADSISWQSMVLVLGMITTQCGSTFSQRV
jgi:hypothetical protein